MQVDAKQGKVRPRQGIARRPCDGAEWFREIRTQTFRNNQS